MKSYFCADVKCPFYKGDDGHSAVVCEGILGSTCVKLSFNTNEPQTEKGRLKNQIKKYCGADYKACPLFKMLMEEKYNGDR